MVLNNVLDLAMTDYKAFHGKNQAVHQYNTT